MEIRLAQYTDAQHLSQLLAQVWRSTYQGIFPKHFLDNLDDNGWTAGFQQSLNSSEVQSTTTILVAELKGKIVGMIAFGNARDPDFPNAYEIYALNVLPHFQRKNIGTALMNSLFEHFQPLNQPLYLKVAVDNLPAQAFYKKVGFYNTEYQSQRQMAGFAFQEWIFQYRQ